MNDTDDESPDSLTREYQQASAAQAGRPGEATRAAILAEARAAALRRTPAANDSRYVWRAVAGVAVVGVAVLLWREAGQPLPATVQVESPVAGNEAPAAAAADATREVRAEARPAAATAPPATIVQEAAEAPTAAIARVAQPAPAPANAVVTLTDRPPPTAAKAERDRADTVAPAANSLADNAAGMSASAGRRSLAQQGAAPPSARILLQRALPEVYASASPPTAAWILVDTTGAVLRSGIVADDDSLQSALATALRDHAGRSAGAVNVSTVTNARGATLQVGVARVE